MLLCIAVHGLVIPEASWRQASEAHSQRVRTLLRPGFMSPQELSVPSRRIRSKKDGWEALDPENPVYNFLLEYYALKGAKATRRLGRWSPPLASEGVTLEGANGMDIADGILSPRGAAVHPDGITYHARAYAQSVSQSQCAAFVWYRDILAATSRATPVLHCYGLHEWAMQYWPDGAAPPPSAKYQRHLPLRVTRTQINAAVERRGVSCTHVDALRYFAPAAAPLNKHGATLQRAQQPDMEQPACVHAAMDLLKMAMKLSPWLPAEILGDALEIALEARTLDVAASPYDLSSYGIAPVCVEDPAGRAEYRRRQEVLMAHAQPIRTRLLHAYDAFLFAGFDGSILAKASKTPNPVHYAQATPGGAAWRWSGLDQDHGSASQRVEVADSRG